MGLVHGNVDERAPRQPYFRRTGRVRTALAPFKHPGCRQQLRAMAHRRYRFARLVERLTSSSTRSSRRRYSGARPPGISKAS